VNGKGEVLKRAISRMPLIGHRAAKLYIQIVGRRFSGSAEYWNNRYANGSNSGPGSYGKLARFKAGIINEFVESEGISSVIEFGCGDGNQLKLARYPRYLGFDVSPAVVERCRREFSGDSSKKFMLLEEYAGQMAGLTASLDVIYHLVEDDVFEAHMDLLFRSSLRYVIIYSSNKDDPGSLRCPHVRDRQFSRWIEKNARGWELWKHVPNRYPSADGFGEGSRSDFYIWKKYGS